ncbi:hypothetical protein NIES4071_25430 [Calothrix sp. NIES-4071]|nr:hypothetical protein NIES4071_25430 [Calothrix sp. NIES-4071]BAZ56866.1 hypothetical protein NIES4105_25370 [Calothrix sp. NIES-4105]
MKTAEQLEAQIQELGRQMADYSRQAVEIRRQDRQQSRLLMRQAYEASKRCQVLIAELLRNQ